MTMGFVSRSSAANASNIDSDSVICKKESSILLKKCSAATTSPTEAAVTLNYSMSDDELPTPSSPVSSSFSSNSPNDNDGASSDESFLETSKQRLGSNECGAAGGTTEKTAITTSLVSSTFTEAASNNNAESEDDSKLMPEDFAEKLVAQVRRRLDTFLSTSTYIEQNTKLEQLPRYHSNDLDLGKTLAKGGFSTIIEVNKFEPPHQTQGEQDKPRQAHTSSNGKQVVIKCLATSLALKKLPGATKDIVFEAHTLAALQHDHIVKVHGWSNDGIDGYKTTRRADGFFLVLDRLGDTLFQRVFLWRNEMRRVSKFGSIKARMQYNELKRQQFQEKMQIAVDVSSALAYCHERRVMHRDIKSANVAFRPSDGRAVLIDFGLACELPAVDPSNPNRTYNLTGNIGTARYMSSEVILEQPYNEKADVHSFAVLCWETFAAKKPYSHLDAKKVKEHVGKWHQRPKVYFAWPRKLKVLLQKGWSREPEKRPSMQEFHATLSKIQKALSKKVSPEE